jgi:hypothetical protein
VLVFCGDRHSNQGSKQKFLAKGVVGDDYQPFTVIVRLSTGG